MRRFGWFLAPPDTVLSSTQSYGFGFVTKTFKADLHWTCVFISEFVVVVFSNLLNYNYKQTFLIVFVICCVFKHKKNDFAYFQSQIIYLTKCKLYDNYIWFKSNFLNIFKNSVKRYNILLFHYLIRKLIKRNKSIKVIYLNSNLNQKYGY